MMHPYIMGLSKIEKVCIQYTGGEKACLQINADFERQF